MKNNYATLLFSKKSIRANMLWAFLLSVVIGFVVTVIISQLVYRYLLNTPRLYLDLFIMVSFVLTFLFFFLLFTRRIIRYLQEIANGLITIAEGNLDYRLPLSRQDELGLVAKNVNFMAEQLQRQQARERQLEKSKMDLISGVSHDLRTPLTSIIGYLNLLKNKAVQDSNEQQRFIDNSFSKTQQLKKLVDDLLEYTNLSSGDVQLSLQQVDLSSLLEQLLTEFEPVAREQGITIIKETRDSPLFVQIDAEKMVRVIDNLLMNALKFSTKPGTIEVQLTSNETEAVLSLSNTGQPITQEQTQLLFERFYKAEPSRSHKDMPAGSGLGLSIAKNIVELMGGRIWLDHHDGLYKFSITLPLSGRKRNESFN